MDMVCEKEPDCTIDFENDPLTLEIEGDYITAKGTTLGGDDGIAVAYALAILDSDTIEHPRLEVVITVSEEVGMDGANGIDLSMLKGKKVLNLDSEEEGHMLASCAGGCTTVCRLPLAFEKKSGELFEIHISGLLGGHSGGEIDKERANSNLLMGRFFLRLSEKTPFAIAELAGGTKDNAIPRETTAKIMLDAGKEDLLMQEIAAYQEILTAEYQSSDKDIKVRAKSAWMRRGTRDDRRGRREDDDALNPSPGWHPAHEHGYQRACGNLFEPRNPVSRRRCGCLKIFGAQLGKDAERASRPEIEVTDGVARRQYLHLWGLSGVGVQKRLQTA